MKKARVVRAILAGVLTQGAVWAQDVSVWSCGVNYAGQLGDGTFVSPRTMLGEVVGLSGRSAIPLVAAGNSHSVAMKADGSVWAWGGGTKGELGPGATAASASPVLVPGVSQVRAMVAGGGRTIVIKADGSAWSWGLGYLGDGTTLYNYSATPVQITGLTTGVTAMAICPLGCHSVAMKDDGTLWSWGDNQWGELGYGTATPISQPVLVPNQVTVFSSAVSVSCGYGFTVVLKNDNTVWSWGKGGALGNGTTSDSLIPVQAKLANDQPLSEVVAVAAGWDHVLALKANGEVWAWGNNTSGNLGIGTTGSAVLNPVKVQIDSVVAIFVASGGSSYAIKSDGTAWSWGGNSSGQLGSGTTQNRPTPGRLGALTDVSSIAGGGGFVLAVHNAPVEEIVTDSEKDRVLEGGTTTFQVKLGAEPAGDKVVTVARAWGDTDISVVSGGTLTFTAANWDSYQTVTLAAAPDADTAQGLAAILLTGPSLYCAMVNVLEVESGASGNQPPTIVSAAWADPAAVTLPAGTTVHVVATDPDGDPLAYAWSQVSGTGTATLATPTAADSGVSFSAAGTYVLRVTVDDRRGGSVTSDVTVAVSGGSGPDPRADCNHDGVVNALDLQIVIANFGKTVP